MKEYIVAVEDDVMAYEEYFVGYIRRQEQLIHCADCRFYNKIITVCRFVAEHEGICRHPQGCIATDPWGYCHYALRKEDVPGEDLKND